MYISLKLSNSIISFHVTSPEYKEKIFKKTSIRNTHGHEYAQQDFAI